MKNILILSLVFISCQRKYDCVCDEDGYQSVIYLGKISNKEAKKQCQEIEDDLKDFYGDTVYVSCEKGLTGIAD